MTAADDAERAVRARQIEERRRIMDALGIELPVMPPRLPGEDDKQYGWRLAEIAKSHCGPPPRKKSPKPLAKPRVSAPPSSKAHAYGPPPAAEVSQNAQFAEPEERLAGMTPDHTTAEEP